MSTAIITQSAEWLQYFDRRAAVESVYAHVAALPSSRTEEQHTIRVYEAGLKYFFSWAADDLPTPDLLRRFIAHLVQRNLKSSTIASKYLAPVRHYLKRLADQHTPGYYGAERDFIQDCRESIRQAAALPTPKPETVSNIPPLWRPEFTRLSLSQVNSVLRQIDRSTIAGLRDYALLHIAFSTGLRLAEIARITLDNITPSGDGAYLLTVRGKRSNTDPVPLSQTAYTDLIAYIDAYNAPLDHADQRTITPTVPVWQPLHRNRYHFAPGRHNPAKGISHQSIREIIARHSIAALGSTWRLAAHDTRRTAAAIAYDAGMPITDIQAFLRHKDPSVTMHYVGTKPDFHKRSLSTYVQFG